MTGSLPPIDSSLVPAKIRQAGPEATKLYQAALSFESILDEQLGQALTSTLQSASSSDDSDSGDSSIASGDAATTMLTQLLPQALSQSLTQSGGLGLASQLYEALGGTTASATTGTAGTSPAAGADANPDASSGSTP